MTYVLYVKENIVMLVASTRSWSFAHVYMCHGTWHVALAAACTPHAAAVGLSGLIARVRAVFEALIPRAREKVKGPAQKVPTFDSRHLAAALVCLAERSPLHQR